jgi:hypothetical protein
MWTYVDYVPGSSDTESSSDSNTTQETNSNCEVDINVPINTPEEGGITLSTRWQNIWESVKSVFSPKSSDNSAKSSETGEGGKITLPNIDKNGIWGWLFFIGNNVAKASDYTKIGYAFGIFHAVNTIYKGLEIGIPAVQKSQESGPLSENAINEAIGMSPKK